MANGVHNIAKGAIAEKFRDAAANGVVALFSANEAETTLVDRVHLQAILDAVGNTEATFTNYARKTALTATVTVDNTNDRVDVDLPDQTWVAAGGASNNTLTKLIVLYAEGGSSTTTAIIPCTHHDFNVVTDGSDLTAQFNAVGFFRAT